MKGAYVAVLFTQTENDGLWFQLVTDGDGDGVRSSDLDNGRDRYSGSAHRLRSSGGIRAGFPLGPPPINPGDPRRRLTRLDDPIRFGRSNMASFSPHGTSSPGSIYLTDGKHLVAVRVLGRTGKIRIQSYDAKRLRWSP